MKKIKKLTSLLFCCLFLYLLAFPGQVQAASLTPTAQDNLSVKLRRSSDLISISNGYMRVFRKTNSVGIEYYDNSLQITDKREIPMELPLWGGFYAGSDGYYERKQSIHASQSDHARTRVDNHRGCHCRNHPGYQCGAGGGGTDVRKPVFHF